MFALKAVSAVVTAPSVTRAEKVDLTDSTLAKAFARHLEARLDKFSDFSVSVSQLILDTDTECVDFCVVMTQNPRVFRQGNGRVRHELNGLVDLAKRATQGTFSMEWNGRKFSAPLPNLASFFLRHLPADPGEGDPDSPDAHGGVGEDNEGQSPDPLDDDDEGEDDSDEAAIAGSGIDARARIDRLGLPLNHRTRVVPRAPMPTRPRFSSTAY